MFSIRVAGLGLGNWGRWRFAIVVVLCGVLLVLLADEGSGDDETGPAMDATPTLWIDKDVIQRRGWVLDAKDADNLITEGYWMLTDAARGRVISVSEDDNSIEVSFANKDGWQRVELAVKRRLKWKANVDDYGNVFSEMWIEEGLRVNPDDHGKIIRNNGSVVVRFPMRIIGLRPPRKGEYVRRGPDWISRRKVDGCRGVDGEETCLGIVVDGLNNEFYVRVKWLKSGLVESHRFDCRRYYDVVLAEPEDDRGSN